MKTVLLFRKPLLLFFLCLLNSLCFSQVIEQWVARYDGPGNSLDVGYDIAVNFMGNVYVTGSSRVNETNTDYTTIKYDANGQQLWIKTYNGTANGFDGATAIATDANGNVYVTGQSEGDAFFNFDYVTIKYDPDGNELWVRRYDGPGNSTDVVAAIAVDNVGNAFITGSSYGNAFNTDYATIKYNTNGNVEWVSRYDGPGNGFDGANSLALDDNGNVYVTGYSTGTGTAEDYATIKYNTNGVQQWVTRYNAPANSLDLAFSLGLDLSGNVYVTGQSFEIESGSAYATVKYNAAGVQQWVSRYHAGAASDVAKALAVDDAGNIYVTGQVNDDGSDFGDDYATIKYDTNGVEQWVAGYNGPDQDNDQATALVIDTAGNVYVTGFSSKVAELGSESDYTTIKYNSVGAEQWIARYDGPGNNTDIANSLAVDAFGNVYVTGGSGTFGSEGTADYTTIKYSQTQNNLPTVSLSIPYNIVKYTAPARIKLNAIATDKDGKITKVQFFNGTTRLHTEDVYPYGFLWIDVPVGIYTLTAKAYDNSGNVTTSNSIKVSVVDENVPPVVSIVIPADDTTYTSPAAIRLIANANDPGDKISKVEFYNGNTLLRTEHYYPYTYWWSNVQPGTYTITAKAYDDKGLSATSKPVKIKVTNASIVSRLSSVNSKTDLNGALSLRLSPVPARSTLQIYTKGLQLNTPSTISIISSSGMLIKTIQSNASDKVVQLDVSSLVNGVYTIKVLNGDKAVYKQFVKL